MNGKWWHGKAKRENEKEGRNRKMGKRRKKRKRGKIKGERGKVCNPTRK